MWWVFSAVYDNNIIHGETADYQLHEQRQSGGFRVGRGRGPTFHRQSNENGSVVEGSLTFGLEDMYGSVPARVAVYTPALLSTSHKNKEYLFAQLGV